LHRRAAFDSPIGSSTQSADAKGAANKAASLVPVPIGPYEVVQWRGGLARFRPRHGVAALSLRARNGRNLS